MAQFTFAKTKQSFLEKFEFYCVSIHEMSQVFVTQSELSHRSVFFEIETYAKTKTLYLDFSFVTFFCFEIFLKFSLNNLLSLVNVSFILLWIDAGSRGLSASCQLPACQQLSRKLPAKSTRNFR